MPEDFDVTAYRDRRRGSWARAGRRGGARDRARRRLAGRAPVRPARHVDDPADGGAASPPPYSDLEPLVQLVLRMDGQVRPARPPELARRWRRTSRRHRRPRGPAVRSRRLESCASTRPPQSRAHRRRARSRRSGSRCSRRCSPSCSRAAATSRRRPFSADDRGALPAHRTTSSRSTSTCSTWSTSAAAATRSTARRTTARCKSTRSCTATRSAGRPGCRRSRRRR